MATHTLDGNTDTRWPQRHKMATETQDGHTDSIWPQPHVRGQGDWKPGADEARHSLQPLVSGTNVFLTWIVEK